MASANAIRGVVKFLTFAGGRAIRGTIEVDLQYGQCYLLAKELMSSSHKLQLGLLEKASMHMQVTHHNRLRLVSQLEGERYPRE